MADISNSTYWSPVDDNNNKAAPNGWPEGMNPGVVNDAARGMMGAVRRDWEMQNATQVAGFSSGAYQLTYPVAPSAYVLGMVFRFFAGAANTGASTLAVNTLGALSIHRQDGTALQAGDLPANALVEVAYNGAAFVLITPSSFLPSATALAASAGKALVVNSTNNGYTLTSDTLGNLYLPKTGGGTVTGSVAVTGSLSAAGISVSGDLSLSRPSAPSTGVVFLGNSGRYVYFDGTEYVMPSSPLVVNGGTVWTSATFNPASYLPLTGGSLSGSLSVSGSTVTNGLTITSALATIGTGVANTPALSMWNNVRLCEVLLDGGGNFGMYDVSAGLWRFYTDNANNMHIGGVCFATNFTGTSDKRLKKNIKLISNGRDTIMALNPSEFDWKSDERHDIGFIAQEVREVIPEAVFDNDDKLSLNMTPIIAHLVAHCQSLEKRLAVLEARK